MAKILLSTEGVAHRTGIPIEMIDAYTRAGLITPRKVIARERPLLTLWEPTIVATLTALYRQIGAIYPRRHSW